MNTLFYNNLSSVDTIQVLITALFTETELLTEISKKVDGVALKTKMGLLRGSDTIVKYISYGQKIAGETRELQTQVNQWFQLYNLQLYPLLKQIRANLFGIPKDKQRYFYAFSEMSRILKTYDDFLSKRTFFVGDSLTIFDICLCVTLEAPFRLLLSEQLRKKSKNLTRWFTFIRQLEPFQMKMGRMILCGAEPIKIDFPEAEKQPESKAQKQKEQDPEGGLILDDFKRSVVNAEDSEKKKKIIDKMLDEFNQQRWSIWRIHYQKDVLEGKVDYLTNNLATGSLKRLQGIHKNAFGSWGVFGVEGDYEIRGVMMWKGTQICKQWKDHPAYIYHLFTKLNVSDPLARAVIYQYWLKLEAAEGLPMFSIKYVA